MLTFALFLALSASSVFSTNSSTIDCFAERDAGYSCNNGTETTRMFYYLPRQGTCQPFQYSGCGGNSNRFSSAKECRDTCKNAQAMKDAGSSDETIQMKTACSAKYDTDHLTPVRCSSNVTSCPSGYNCISSFCCPTANYLCNINYDSGKFSVGGSKSDKYFWVPKYSTCMRFSFYGTLGNENNFPNYNSCMQTCSNLNSTVSQ